MIEDSLPCFCSCIAALQVTFGNRHALSRTLDQVTNLVEPPEHLLFIAGIVGMTIKVMLKSMPIDNAEAKRQKVSGAG